MSLKKTINQLGNVIAQKQIEQSLKEASLSTIATIVRKDWKNVYFGARPYLDALAAMDKIQDNFGADNGVSIVSYFLANANTWRGPIARAVKAELNRRVKSTK